MEMALTQLVINIRYALMSVSLSQKLDSSVKTFQRMLIAYGIQMRFLQWQVPNRELWEVSICMD